MAKYIPKKKEMRILFLVTINVLVVTIFAGTIDNSTYVILVKVQSENENSFIEALNRFRNDTKYFINIYNDETWHVVYHHHPNQSKIATVEQNIRDLRQDLQGKNASSVQVKGVLSGFLCEKQDLNEKIVLPLTKLGDEVVVDRGSVKCVGSPYFGAHWSQSDIGVILNPMNSYNDISQFAKNLTLTTSMDVDEIRSLTSRLNSVANQSAEMLNKLQEHNDTNVLLATVDRILLQVRNVTGFEEKVLDKVAVRVENINETGGSGIAVIGNPEETRSGRQHFVHSLHRNDTIENIFNLNLTAAIQLPASALHGKNRVVFTAFSNGTIFKVNSVKSAVIGVVIEGESGWKLNEPVRLFFRRSQSVSPNPGKCVYWDFDANSSYGNWSEGGCKLHKVHKSEESYIESEDTCDSEIENFVIDEFHCDHLTHFGELMSDHDVFKPNCNPILDSISLWGSVISLGFTLIYIAICVLNKEDLLKRPGEKSKLQLTVNFSILLVLFIIASKLKIQSQTWRVVLGVFTHYFMLSNFTWMFNAAILQYRRLVIVFNVKSKKFRLILSLMAWTLPIFPPLIAYSVGGKEAYSAPPLYLPRGLLFYLSIVFPLSIVLFFNSIIFVRIAVNLYFKPEMRVHGGKKKNESFVRLKQLVFLFIVFGIVWLFAIGQIVANKTFSNIFSYLFVISISIQGFAYFVLFVVMDKDVKTKLLSVRYFKDRIFWY